MLRLESSICLTADLIARITIVDSSAITVKRRFECVTQAERGYWATHQSRRNYRELRLRVRPRGESSNYR